MRRLNVGGRRGVFAVVAVVLVAVMLVCDVAVGFGHLVGIAHSGTNGIAPAVIAHRGDAAAPENSLAAIRGADRIGADYAEIDIRLTSDGEPVVFHDRATGRLSAAGRNVLVSRTPLRQLQRMTMRQNGQNYRIPTLVQALRTAQRTRGHLGLLLHVKTDDRHARAVADTVIRSVETARFTNNLMIMSTSREAIVVFKQREPNWRIGLCASGEPQLTGWDIRDWRTRLLDRLARGSGKSGRGRSGGRHGDGAGENGGTTDRNVPRGGSGSGADNGTTNGTQGDVVRGGDWDGRELPMDFVVVRAREATRTFLREAKRHDVPVYVGAVNDARTARSLIRQGAAGFLGEDVEQLRRAADEYALA
ncbi:glycerophosphodiester phosphodiesterase [Bifidobacterium amazonense]|uniref:Glycerophosphodiester phosphodiesterase n=1 Tax=Bifidobacterium amazonense TaxID=2809027 RepID=A0ABS9VVT0_9BIFI|nr:glycerophosphodiester phosphodiesterase family protein [Bifidobacterium amazonense]MCH9275915.1 glycerophosphodiester phosphodiesterase [Bifidobacterium amazonense]